MKKILTLLLVSTFLLSCSNDDTASNSAFNGCWRMQGYLAFMDAGDIPVLEEGDITWTFFESGTKLQVVNNVEQQYPFIMQSGLYEVSTQGSLITINGHASNYSLETGALVISDTNETGDGPIQVFSRQIAPAE
jgi:hypothetical protein